MKKYLKVPSDFTSDPFCQASLKLDGFSVVESCIHSMGGHGTMYLEEHLLLLVLEGAETLTYGKQKYTVGNNEMIFLKKSSFVKYKKQGNPKNDNIYDSLMFFLKDDLLKDFLTMANLKLGHVEGEIKTTVNPMNECLIAFAESLKPYFNNPSTINQGLLRLKILELLYNISDCSKNMFRQILQLKNPVRADIRQIVEQHYASPITILELAYLSGRSLSSFKRDFQQIYNIPPAQWIREKKLEKAKEMLQNTPISVSEICYTLGFENVSSFSQIFRKYYKQSPSEYRNDS